MTSHHSAELSRHRVLSLCILCAISFVLTSSGVPKKSAAICRRYRQPSKANDNDNDDGDANDYDVPIGRFGPKQDVNPNGFMSR